MSKVSSDSKSMKKSNSSTVMSATTSSSWRSWQSLPDLIFSDIMMMAGMTSLDDLHKSRQVCQCWNEMISQMTKLKKDTIRSTAESQATVIRDTGRLYFTHQVSLS